MFFCVLARNRWSLSRKKCQVIFTPIFDRVEKSRLKYIQHTSFSCENQPFICRNVRLSFSRFWQKMKNPKNPKIYNLSGELVRALELGHIAAGKYMNKQKAAYWNGKNQLREQVTSGVYFYTFEADNYVDTKKLLILK